MANKLTKKLQVLLSEETYLSINRIILDEAMKNEKRPISVSAFIRDLIEKEMTKYPTIQTWRNVKEGVYHEEEDKTIKKH
tara:strand:+ start:241 stop:480 length:240 start_codon:yes stop_codon:yes gene_type:complete